MSSLDLSGIEIAPTFNSGRITADLIADSLRQAIQTGALPDGAVLNQVALAERFAVSRQPVREAMRQLLAEGLIESRAHHGSVVRGLPLERIGEIYDNIAVLEGNMVEKAMPRITPEIIAELREENATMTGMSDIEAWLERNQRFHTRLVVLSGDETGLELVTQLRGRAERYVRMWAGTDNLHHPDRAGDEHELILAALEQGDGARARKLLEEHVHETGHRLVELGLKFTDRQ